MRSFTWACLFGVIGFALMAPRLLDRDEPAVLPSLLESLLSCPAPSLSSDSTAPLLALRRKHYASAASIAAARKRNSLKRLPRVQIVNGTLHVSCGTPDRCKGIGHELRTLGLLLKLSHVQDVDFYFDEGERPCYMATRRKKHGRGRKRANATSHAIAAAAAAAAAEQGPRPWDVNVLNALLPVVTHETTHGCTLNVLAPPRAFKALPEGSRWLARTGELSDVRRWSEGRRNLAVWRGAATGGSAIFDAASGAPGIPRATAVELSRRRPDLLDARFAGRNDDLQMGSADRERVRQRGWGADGTGFLTWRDLQGYRAQLVLDGNTLPDRLPFTLFTMTAVLKQESPLREAWYRELRPYVHYVPVAHNLSDLEAKLKWALSNASRLHGIAANGAKLAQRWLSRRAQLCHWSSLLRELSALSGDRRVVLDAAARRVYEAGSLFLGNRVLHNPIDSPLRPQLRSRPPRLSDLRAFLNMHVGPCIDRAPSHLCLDL